MKCTLIVHLVVKVSIQLEALNEVKYRVSALILCIKCSNCELYLSLKTSMQEATIVIYVSKAFVTGPPGFMYSVSFLKIGGVVVLPH